MGGADESGSESSGLPEPEADPAPPAAPGRRPTARDDLEPQDPKRSAVWALVVSAAVTALVLWAAVRLLVQLDSAQQRDAQTTLSAETTLSIVFVSAAVVLILVLSALSIVFRRLRLSDPQAAMGMPYGSIRAVIALLLVMLFFIAALYLFNHTQNTPGDARNDRHLAGIDATRLAAIPTDQIKELTSRTVGRAVVYDVTLQAPSANTNASDDIAKQLVTTVGTLVTAVAAFYFGANSVTSALNTTKPPAGTGPMTTPGPTPPTPPTPSAPPAPSTAVRTTRRS
jgi:heme/copper-type cytochrome/quinol oxidase subunit 2